jgi:hypothetical protein
LHTGWTKKRSIRAFIVNGAPDGRGYLEGDMVEWLDGDVKLF